MVGKNIFECKLSLSQSAFFDIFILFVRSRINQLQEKESNLFVIDIKEYTNILIQNFELLQNLKGVELKLNYEKEYNELIESKISEGNDFLALLQDEIQNEQKKIDILITQLEKEIEGYLFSDKYDLNKLEMRRANLKRAKKQRFLFGVLEVFVKNVFILSIIPPSPFKNWTFQEFCIFLFSFLL